MDALHTTEHYTRRANLDTSFALLVGKQSGFDHENYVRIGTPTSRQIDDGFSRCVLNNV
jgi:hypothetical protein